jgi:hypothetical protein
VGTPLGIGVLHPLLAEVIGSAETVVALTVIAIALFGSQALVERAYRLLRWFGNRPEPPAPASRCPVHGHHKASAAITTITACPTVWPH